MKKFWCRLTGSSKNGASSRPLMEVDSLKAILYEVNLGEKRHTILKTPDDFIQNGGERGPNSSLNLIMVDVSGSMRHCWPAILEHWNRILLPAVKGASKLFVFGSGVHFRRHGAYLESADFLSQSTNLTEAIKRINSEIQSCDKNFIRLFLVTDGHHTATRISPEIEINKLSIPNGKTIEVYLLGIGNSFPVEYSISIRSALHNGNSNVPSLFWATENEDREESCSKNIDEAIKEEILSMEEIVRKENVALKISPPGKLSPGLPDTDTAYLGEYIYFPCPPEDISSTLKFFTEDKQPVNVEIAEEVLDVEDLLDNVFCQWNSLIIQQHRKKNKVPEETFEVMDKIYNNSHNKMLLELRKTDDNTNSINTRLEKKRMKTSEIQYSTQMNQSKRILGVEGKCDSEIELANCIVQSTVRSKCQRRNQKKICYKMDSYKEDMNEFSNIYETLKEQIISLPEPTPDACCRITMDSLIKDLKDPLLASLLQEDKTTFIKNFTVTGIPIFLDQKSSQTNCWNLCIESTLKSPYIIVSRSTMETTEDVDNKLAFATDKKQWYLKPEDEATKFNAIVPIVSADVSETLKPLIRTNIFAMLSSFCILKNSHVTDHNAHIAALACTWMKIIQDYPAHDRPEFAATTISSIEATAKLYLDREDIAKYLNVLLTETAEALTSGIDDANTFVEKDLKCESLIKPLFLLFLTRENIEIKQKMLTILPLLITEFTWRCLSSYISPDECIYSYFFVPETESKEKRKKWFDRKMEQTASQILEDFVQKEGKLLQTYFILEHLRKSLKVFCSKHFESMQKSMYPLRLNMSKMNILKNDGKEENIGLSSLRSFARELNIEESTIDELFSEEKLFVSVCHGLQCRSSGGRTTAPLPSYEEALKQATNLVSGENCGTFRKLCLEKVIKDAERLWTEEFLSLHENTVVRPMSQTQILYAASQRGVAVDSGFQQLFKYNAETRLLTNACMVDSCPFYLRPSSRFSQHVSVERRQLGYPHQLHQITADVASNRGDATDVIEALLGGACSDVRGRARVLPSEHRLNSLANQIQTLIADYKHLTANPDSRHALDK